MHPAKIVREKVRKLTDLPNIGPAMAGDFVLLGYSTPQALAGSDPLDLYLALCVATGVRHDPCVLDTFMSVTHFLGGGAPEPWWNFTAQRKRHYGKALGSLVDASLAGSDASTPKPQRGLA